MHFEEAETSTPRGLMILTWVLTLASMGFFVACLGQSAYTVDGKAGLFATSGLDVLLSGWMGFLYGMIEWYANPLLTISWLLALLDKTLAGLLCAFGALALALGFLDRATMILDESPNDCPIVSRDLGYWLWIAAIATSLVALVIPMLARFVRSHRQLRSNRW